MRNKSLLLIFSLLLCLQTSAQQTQAFQDTTLTDEQRVDHLLSILTLDEKINLLSTDLGVPRLNIPRCGHYEGLHGLTLGGPAMWGGRQRTEDGKVVPTDCPTTIFPQSYGLGSTWDTDLVQKVAEQAAEEARYYMQTTGNKRHALVMRAPNADLARDPRWDVPRRVSEKMLSSPPTHHCQRTRPARQSSPLLENCLSDETLPC